MGTIPYKRGVRDFQNHWYKNPYTLGSSHYAEWEKGHADASDAEAKAQEAARQQDQQRRREAWGVPERAMDEWLAMVDVCGEPASRAILDFVKAYCRVGDDE